MLPTRLGGSGNVNMVTRLTCSVVELCFFNVFVRRLGVSVVTVTFVLVVSTCFFYVLQAMLGITGIVNTVTRIT